MNEINNEKIDFVITWVDGNDEKWIKEKNEYSKEKGDKAENRFRDCNNLQYLFRSIEKYAPWVNNIFFITCGQTPKWLNTKHPKLKLINHTDYIDSKYLPTFNSNVIELNLHKIKGLSEKFVLFNDDIFILKKVNKEDFFSKGLPVDTYVEYAQLASKFNDTHYFMKANILAIINQEFKKKKYFLKNIYKCFNLKYGKLNLHTRHWYKIKDRYCGFWNFHNPQPYLKSNFKKIWDLRKEDLDKACYNRFRKSTDLGHYIVRYMQLVTGQFTPGKNNTKYLEIDNDIENVNNIILNNTDNYKVVCINDTVKEDFEIKINKINKALNKIFPKKSKYEI